MNPEYAGRIKYICVVGSRGYGLSTVNSDWDYRGFYVAPTNSLLGLFQPPEQLEVKNDRQDEVYYEVGKFIRLALKASPNMLEMLWTNLVELDTFESDLIRSNRQIFVSQRVATTHLGWANQQLSRLEAHRRASSGDINWKNAMHTVRILESLKHLLLFQEPLVDVHEDRLSPPGRLTSLLRVIKSGSMSLEEVLAIINAQRDILTRLTENNLKNLPIGPDEDKANEILLAIRKHQGFI